MLPLDIAAERRYAIGEALLDWYDDQKRSLPWRDHPDSYAVWISEIMLQQTQVTTVLPYFERWMEHFPSVQALAEAPLDVVLKAWEGLGYYSRARNLHAAAQQVVAEHGGDLPRTVEGLMALPGIGRYTAGAIASIAFGVRAVALDGNLKRVLARLTTLDLPINRPNGERALWDIAEALLPAERAGDWNQALMDLGATICLAKQPRCLLCPASSLCEALQQGKVEQYPVREARRSRPHYTVVAGVIWNATRDCLLVAQRPTDKMLGGLWEFPGGKVEGDESLAEALHRELREELGIEVEVHDELTVVQHGYTHFTITLHAFHCTHIAGEPQALGVADWRWMALDDLDKLPWPRTDQQIIAALRG